MQLLWMFSFVIGLLLVWVDVINASISCNAFGPNISQYAVGVLPGVDYKLPASWAGQIGIPGTQNDALFFWLFESEKKEHSNDLIIWLNGGPGCSSLGGLTLENGPLAFFGASTKPEANPYSWTKLANVLYIDQPVGTGFSSGRVAANNNSKVTQDFLNWLEAFYAKFPALKSMNTYIMGESYAGIYIPYFVEAILANTKVLNINLRAIALGDPAMGNNAASLDVVVTPWMHKHNAILNISQDVFNIFAIAQSKCGFSDVLKQLTYPPHGEIIIPGNPEGGNFKVRKRQVFDSPECNALMNPTTIAQLNESIYGPCFGPCASWWTANSYLVTRDPCFSPYNIKYNCKTTPNTKLPTSYLNLAAVKAAIHAPDKAALSCNRTIDTTLVQELVDPPAYSIIPSIIEHGIEVHIYSSEYDFLINHIGTELVIQNMTWCGKQGFQLPPNHTFYANGKVAGTWGYERGLSYHYFLKAGHEVPHDQPASVFAFVRDFVTGKAGYKAKRVAGQVKARTMPETRV